MCLASILSFLLGRDRIAIIFLWVAGVSCTISLFAPFWMHVYKTQYIPYGNCHREDIGLMGECCATSTKCVWIWQEDFTSPKNFQEWLFITRILFATGYVLMFPMLIMSLVRCCSECCRLSVNISRMFCVVSFLSCCMFSSAVIYFWIQLFHQSALEVLSGARVKSWAFVACCVGAAALFVSSFFWFLDGRRKMESHNLHQDQERNPPRERRRFLFR